MQNIITLVYRGLGFKMADRVHIDQLNAQIFNEWLKIPLESRGDLVLMIADVNDFSPAFCGTQIGEFRFIFMVDYKADFLIDYFDLSIEAFRGMPPCHCVESSAGKLADYAKKYVYKSIFREIKDICEPAEAL